MPLIAETEALDGRTTVIAADQMEAADSAESPLGTKEQAQLLTDAEMFPSSSPDAKLETRLHLLEQALTEIETRLKQAETSSARAASLSEHGTAALFQRMESFERQQVAAVRSLIVDLEAERREGAPVILTTKVPGDGVESNQPSERAVQPDHMPEPDELTPSAPEESSVPTEMSHQSLEKNDYLAAAQRAANAAATLASLDGRQAAAESRWEALVNKRVRLQRKHYALAAGIVSLAFFMAAPMAFYAGRTRGHEMAAQPVAQHRATQTNSAGSRDTTNPRSSLAAKALAGDAHAQLLLGLNYLQGNGVALSPSKAVDWVRKAAQHHDPMAQYWLGTLYAHGDGISPDSAEAIRWYEAAAAQGNRKAMHALGVAFAQGQGVPQNYADAAAWFAKAAELGLVNSEFNLGVLYERGLGVPQSLREAYRWYAVAAARGDEESRVRIETLQTQLSAQDIMAAQDAAATFHPQPMVEPANNLPNIANLIGRTSQRR